jgi:hypothetical protein
MANEILERLKRYDEGRPGFPGEHWLALAAGIGLWVATRKHPSGSVRLLAGIAGGLLVARALSGRRVPRPLQRAIPYATETSRVLPSSATGREGTVPSRL